MEFLKITKHLILPQKEALIEKCLAGVHVPSRDDPLTSSLPIILFYTGVTERSILVLGIKSDQEVGAGIGDSEDAIIPQEEWVLKGHAQQTSVDDIALAMDGTGAIWSCGEDKTARYWGQDGKVDRAKMLRHKTSIWCILPLEVFLLLIHRPSVFEHAES